MRDTEIDRRSAQYSHTCVFEISPRWLLCKTPGVTVSVRAGWPGVNVQWDSKFDSWLSFHCDSIIRVSTIQQQQQQQSKTVIGFALRLSCTSFIPSAKNNHKVTNKQSIRKYTSLSMTLGQCALFMCHSTCTLDQLSIFVLSFCLCNMLQVYTQNLHLSFKKSFTTHVAADEYEIGDEIGDREGTVCVS